MVRGRMMLGCVTSSMQLAASTPRNEPSWDIRLHEAILVAIDAFWCSYLWKKHHVSGVRSDPNPPVDAYREREIGYRPVQVRYWPESDVPD